MGLAGFWYGCLAGLAVWLFVVVTSLIYLEATLANPDGANMRTISRNLLGRTGSTIGSIAFIYAHNSILAIYFLFGTLLFNDVCQLLLGFKIPDPFFHIPLILIVGAFIFFGVRWCGWLAGVCLLLFIGTLIYVLIRGGGMPPYPPRANHWLYLLLSIPILYDTLFIQTIIPSLATFMKRDWVKLKCIIWIGLFSGLFINMFWLWLVIGSTPRVLIFFEYQNYDAIYGVTKIISQIPIIGNTIHMLNFLAFIASMPIVSIVLFDFYSDLFKLTPPKRKGWKRLGICILTLIPPFLFSHIPKLQIEALINYTLGFTLLLISAIFPLLWIISARYIRKKTYPHRLGIKGGTLTLYAIATFFLLYIEGVQLIKL